MHNKFKIKASILKKSQDINTIYAHTNQTANVQTAQMFYFCFTSDCLFLVAQL